MHSALQCTVQYSAQCSTVHSAVQCTVQYNSQCSAVLTVQYSPASAMYSAVQFCSTILSVQRSGLLEVLCTVACSCITTVGWLGTRHYLVSVIATGSAPTVTTAGVSLARGLNKSILRGSHIRRRQLQRCPQLAMRSLRPENFSTSEGVLHTCGPTQTVAKYVSYRWNNKYLFVWREANKMDYVLFKTIHALGLIYYLNCQSSSWNCSWELWDSAHRWRVNIILELILTELKS